MMLHFKINLITSYHDIPICDVLHLFGKNNDWFVIDSNFDDAEQSEASNNINGET